MVHQYPFKCNTGQLNPLYISPNAALFAARRSLDDERKLRFSRAFAIILIKRSHKQEACSSIRIFAERFGQSEFESVFA